MQQIITGSLADPRFAARYAAPMFQLRYRVFHERLRWDVRCDGDMEYDDFDDAHSLYLLAAENGRTVGGWRLRPTTQPYMLSDVFPQLLHGQKPPRSPSIWEISRFAVDTDAQTNAGFGFNEVAREMVRSTIQLAVDNDISQYVMVVSVAVERLLCNTGMVLHRFGPPQRIGRVRSVACWLDIDGHTRHVILGHPWTGQMRAAA